MKLRIWRNALRLRLSQSEVASLAAGSRIDESIEFPSGGALRYSILPMEQGALTTRYSSDRIEVFVPRESARAWADSNDVGLYADGALQIAVEKDFRCVAGPASENASDAYPNPSKSC
ncbi:MAG: hypothetical protein ABI165_01940 [Bryobacteraceae bacterium]